MEIRLSWGGVCQYVYVNSNECIHQTDIMHQKLACFMKLIASQGGQVLPAKRKSSF